MLSARRPRHGERGQTIPFWAFSIVMGLSLIFFVYNYSNAIRYQIRAQNASDSAATAALSGDAARLNSVQTLLMALNVQEFKVRNVVSAVPSLLTGGDSNCTNLVLSSQCLNDLGSAVNSLQAEVNNLASVQNALSSFSGQLTGNNLSNVPGTVSSLFANDCVQLSTDCAFKYTTSVTLVNGLPVVNEYACENVPTFESTFFPNAPKTYKAVGHTVYTLAPLSQNINAANNEGGLADTILAQNLNLFPGISGNTIVGNFANFSLNTGYYAPVPALTSVPAVSSKTLC